ncbi:MAG: polyprenyl synthetase family protein [Bacteroidetes bacterium]|nr:polyprenyl synthetase family protein [Bacteroidota bacterium]
MQSFSVLLQNFEQRFNKRHFPGEPQNLYDASQYILKIGGKRVRPVCVLMGNELFDEIDADAYEVAAAIELFHNFSLIHDDIMDKAPLRRGMETVHTRYGESTALLAGDVMLVAAYDYINKIKPLHLQKIISLFNKTAREVCEGQQMDMDFEKESEVSFEAYEKMITLKTSVLLAASMQMGAILGGAGGANQQHLYEFGKKLGIAFQVQDDYLDAFGDPEKFGKQPGGDIIVNKKTFLMIHALDVAKAEQKAELNELMKSVPEADEAKKQKVEKVLKIFRDCKVDAWAEELKDKYYREAMKHLEDIAVLSSRKTELEVLAKYLLQRDK